MEKQEVNKIEFEIKAENNSKVSDLKLEVKVNGNTTEAYTYESLNIYKVNNDIEGICDLKSTQTKLSDSYVLKDGETYVIEIEELAITNMTYSSAIWQVDDTTFINGMDITKVGKYCMGSKYEDGNSESFSFILPESTIIEDNENNIQNENQQTTTEVIEENSNDINNENNQFYTPIIISFICIVILVIIILIYKNKKKNENM